MKLIDLHNDVITETTPVEFEQFIANAEKNGVAKIFISVWCTEIENVLTKIANFKKQLEKIKTKISLNLHIEDCHYLSENNLNEFLNLNLFSAGIVWNHNNALAGGAFADGGLTPFGKKVINEFQKNNVLIDLAHLNRKSFWQVCNEINTPLFCSHTCFYKINPHPRNLDYYQIKKIKESNGLIGLTFVPDFLTSDKICNYNHILKHISYFLEKFGDDNLAIGTDFYGSKSYPTELNDYADFKKFEKFLLENKISKKSIEKIFYDNARKFLKERKSEI